MHSGGSPILWMHGKKAMTKYLFEHTHHIINRIKKADHIFLFLDYDGTLIHFQQRPQDVNTPSEVRDILNQLIHHPSYSVFVITGRPLQEIKQLLPLNGLSYAGLHGIEIEWAHGKRYFWNQAALIKTLLQKIKKEAQRIFKQQREIIIEDKTFSLAFHYRLLPEHKTQSVIETIESIIKRIDEQNNIQRIYGAKVIELRPQGWNKGNAVGIVLDNNPSSEDILPIYIGDDTTDEDAFKQIKNQGITIYVKNHDNRETAAEYIVSDPDDILFFLKSLTTIQFKKN